MQISEVLDVLNIEKILGKTPWGRPLSEYAVEVIEATMQDEKNHHVDIIQCLGCGFIFSSLLTSEGCPNCGVLDLTLNAEQLKLRRYYGYRTGTIGKISWQCRFRAC